MAAKLGALTSRRSLFGLFAITLPFLARFDTDAEGNTKNNKPVKLLVRSPKDGFIVNLRRSNQNHIVAGDIICSLGSEDEFRAMERVVLSGKLIDIEAAALKPGIIDTRRNLLKKAIELTEQYIDIADLKLNTVKVKYASTPVPAEDLAQAMAVRFKAGRENEKAKAALQLFELGTSQSLERLKLLQEQVAKEEDFIRNKIAELMIHAPRNGELNLLVAEGSFLKKGQVIAEIS